MVMPNNKVKEKMLKLVQLHGIDVEKFQAVLGLMVDLMEYNGDDTYMDIMDDEEAKEAFEFIDQLAKQ